jgi:predicted acetyltransferase
MDRIKLVSPSEEHKDAAESYKKEFFDCGEAVINGSALLDQMEYDEWLVNTKRNSNPQTARADWVPASTFFAIRESDSRIIGMIDIRHNLNNEFLAQYGGHIGYSVRPGERRKGYAAKMLQQALDYARCLGLSNVMLGCYSDNLASKKTIETCNSRLTEVKPYLDGRMMNVYWIDLTIIYSSSFSSTI